MSTSSIHPMSFGEFRTLVAKELQLEPAQVEPQSSFVEDLMVDSIRMVDLMLRLEELGIVFPPEAAWDIRTVQDAYECYLKHNAPGLRAPREVTAS
ncbi:MAG: acyl carrier protein [Anaerolineae bacterium]|nr:acyl carrier protein [Anaerolineae bacterium]